MSDPISDRDLEADLAAARASAHDHEQKWLHARWEAAHEFERAEEYKRGMRGLASERDALAAVIEQVRALHTSATDRLTISGEPECEECSDTYPCPTVALLPPAEEPQ